MQRNDLAWDRELSLDLRLENQYMACHGEIQCWEKLHSPYQQANTHILTLGQVAKCNYHCSFNIGLQSRE
jgi:hypothetical protein